jgi:colanic acid biosynthesis glycosyl transferase WcaI
VNLVVIAPHFTPDVAPTGVVITRIVEELVQRGHRIHVFTSYPWYEDHRVDPTYEGRWVRHEDTPWGRITRVHPFPTSDKRNILKRALSFAGFSAVLTYIARRGERVDGVLAMSPPLTLGLSGWAVGRARKAPFVFNVQDVFPDVAIDLEVLTDRRLIAAARRVERFCYDHADAVTVLSEDLQGNVRSKTTHPERVHVIPNFVDTETIKPSPRENAYRREFGLEGKTVVMYAGNVGLSQSLEMVIDAAAALAYEESLAFVINGQGAARSELERRAAGLPNVRFVDLQPAERLPEVLAAGDVHLVPLKRGLGRSSVPSKTYSILAAGRPLIASVDEGSEVARTVERAGAGVALRPDDAEALTKAIRRFIDAPDELQVMGAAGRRFVESWASPAAVAEAYERLFDELRD